MAIASVACPKCMQTFRSSDDVLDTRIRCPLCGSAFVVERFVSDDEPPIAKAAAKKKSVIDDEDDPNPYGVKTVEIKPRCPDCANEMESEDAIICVYCGYNTQTRTHGKTKRVVHQTGADKMQWLMPGILCVAGILGIALFQVIYTIGFGSLVLGSDSTLVNLIFCEPIYIWITMIGAGIMWRMGQFAFKRLLLEPTPPEVTEE